MSMSTTLDLPAVTSEPLQKEQEHDDDDDDDDGANDYGRSRGKEETTTTPASPPQEPNTQRDEEELKETTEDDDNKLPWPEDVRKKKRRGRKRSLRHMLCGTFASWTYSYMRPILRKGRMQYKNGEHLVYDDLYQVPDDMRAEVLVRKFWEKFEETGNLKSALWSVAAPSFVPAGLWEALYVLSRISLPLSLRELLIVLETNPGEAVVQEGLPYAITLALAALVSAFAQNRTVFLSTRSGITLRAALTSAIYEHSLRLSPEGSIGLAAGHVTTLVATDTQKIYDVMLEAHNIWSCPIIIVAVTILLWVTLGPELIIGVVLLILFVPLVQYFVSRMLRIRRQRASLSDTRINILASMLQGIHVSKINHYESKIEDSVQLVRDKEMKLLRTELEMWGWVISCAVVSPLIAAGVSFACYVLIDENNVLTPSDAFSTLLFFSILRFPINLTARVVGKTAQASDSVRRISEFLKRDTRPFKGNTDFNHSSHRGVVVDMNDCTFTANPENKLILSGLDEEEEDTVLAPTSLSRVSSGSDVSRNHDPPSSNVQSSGTSFTITMKKLQVCKSEVVAVIGKVGSGKTMLLRALLGELESDEWPSVVIKGKIAYAAQQPFILNATLRDNVLFGSEYEQQRYERALDACCLREDVQRLGPAGDLTEIGERGVTLSGGQKQRVALARAIFSNPSVSLLDDCFSALDATTGGMVFENLFATDGILRTSGTILVTHGLHLLREVDYVLALKGGCASFCGTWPEFRAWNNDDSIDIVRDLQLPSGGRNKNKHTGHLHKKGLLENEGLIMSAEERRHGISSLSVWVEWFSNAGGWPFFLLQFLFLVFDRGFYLLGDWWLASWSGAVYEGFYFLGIYFPPQIKGRSAQVRYVSVYAIIILLSVVAGILRSQWAVAGGARCAHKMFKAMTKRVLRAPLSYYNTTPLGRILNRFTYDVEVLDIELSISMVGLMIALSWLVASVIVMSVVLPWILIGIVPVCIVYFLIQLYYRMSGPDLQRIDAMSRSPLQASLAEALEGVTTIRAYKKEEKFIQFFQQSVDRNSSAMLNFEAAQRWLGLRIELLGATIGFTLTTTIVCANDRLQIPAGLVGLVVQWSIFFTTALNYFFIRFAESEGRITSVERIHEMTCLPLEASWETDPSFGLDPKWPSKGEIEFENVCMRYRDNLPLALNSVSFKLSSGVRCGVVGRTGAGKSSLATALFRLVEIESGRIILDGVDVSKIGLGDLRGRPSCLRMIPQDPVLFAGTTRDCVDPFQCATDDNILDALQAVNHRGARTRGMEALKDKVDEGGANFSVGERQLLCIARALVEQPKVLVLDEATASIDSETDHLIQEMLRTRFSDTTLITVAHRLSTIIDFDVILALQDGRSVEFGPPKELLKDPRGILSSLVEATGPETAAELHNIANREID